MDHKIRLVLYIPKSYFMLKYSLNAQNYSELHFKDLCVNVCVCVHLLSPPTSGCVNKCIQTNIRVILALKFLRTKAKIW